MLRNKTFRTALLSVLIALALGGTCLANSAEPPRYMLFMEEPQRVENIVLLVDGVEVEGTRISSIWGKYYQFNTGDIGRLLFGKNDYAVQFSVKVTLSDGVSFTVPRYNPSPRAVQTLDINNQTIVEGRYVGYNIAMAIVRFVLTLLIEGTVFFLFGFRKMRSWICFICVNLITQAYLSIMLSFMYGPSLTYTNYLIYLLLYTVAGAEIIILVAESIVLSLSVKEKSKESVVGFAVATNLLSLALGWLILTYLPI